MGQQHLRGTLAYEHLSPGINTGATRPRGVGPGLGVKKWVNGLRRHSQN